MLIPLLKANWIFLSIRKELIQLHNDFGRPNIGKRLWVLRVAQATLSRMSTSAHVDAPCPHYNLLQKSCQFLAPPTFPHTSRHEIHQNSTTQRPKLSIERYHHH